MGFSDSVVVDTSVQLGRVDVVQCSPHAGPVDVYLMVHTRAGDVVHMGRELIASIRSVYGNDVALHIRARVYAGQSDSVVSIVTEDGWRKWVGSPNLSESKRNQLQASYAEHLLGAYKLLVCSMVSLNEAGERPCVHETCFGNGTVCYWEGA